MLNKREKNQTWNITAKDKHDKALHKQQYVPFVHGSQESLHCSKISSSTKVPLALSKLELLPAPPSNPTETNCHCNTFDQLLRCNFRYCNLASESFKRMTKKWICMSSESVNIIILWVICTHRALMLTLLIFSLNFQGLRQHLFLFL